MMEEFYKFTRLRDQVNSLTDRYIERKEKAVKAALQSLDSQVSNVNLKTM